MLNWKFAIVNEEFVPFKGFTLWIPDFFCKILTAIFKHRISSLHKWNISLRKIWFSNPLRHRNTGMRITYQIRNSSICIIAKRRKRAICKEKFGEYWVSSQ